MIYYPKKLKRTARHIAQLITRYVHCHGGNCIIGITKIDGVWNVAVPSDIAQIWPNVCDIATEEN